MRSYSFVTVDVFTDRRFGGNPLAVFPDARGLSSAEMQSIAREFNLSETTFVLPPANPSNTAQVRIFTPAVEMPFAGHPNVGTGYVLARLRPDAGALLRFEEIAGVVEVAVERNSAGSISGATITAPQPLQLASEIDAATVARCIGLETADIVASRHAPVAAGMGTTFVMVQVTPDALARARPDAAAFAQAQQRHAELDRFFVHLYALDAGSVRARMFAPLGGVPEDAATGSANVALAGLLLSLTDERESRYDIVQGVQMGRPSLLRTRAWHSADGIRATVGGDCVEVMRGEISLD